MLLSFKCLSGDIVSAWSMYDDVLHFTHIYQSTVHFIGFVIQIIDVGTMRETLMMFAFVFNDWQRSVIYVTIWLAVLSMSVPMCRMMCSGLKSCKVGFTWSFMQLSLAEEKGHTLRIQWRLFFAIIIRCYRLQLWEGCFTYFKIMLVVLLMDVL